MRKVVAGLFISVDGVVESPDKWQFDHFDEDMMANMGSHIAAEDTILLLAIIPPFLDVPMPESK
jgi:hypothetical protein